MGIANSVALVTGANRGIGAQFVRELQNRGASTVYAAARDPDRISVPGVEAVALDLTDPASVAAAAAVASDVTLLVNNAGIANTQDLVTGDLTKMRAEMETNVFGTLSVIRAFAPVLASGGGGAIVNVLSAASWFPYPGSGSYAMSKAAEWILTTSVRMELAGQGTQVLGAHVGMVDTEMSAAFDVPKLDPAEFVRTTLDGLEEDEVEVVADDLTRRAKAALVHPPGRFVP